MPLEPTSPAFTHEGEIPARIGDLSAALESFEGMDTKVLDEVPGGSTGAESEAHPKEEPEGQSVDDFGASDPVRLYLKEMGKFQLLTREGEVEVAKRIEAGEKEVEEETLKSPVMLDYVIRIGEQVRDQIRAESGWTLVLFPSCCALSKRALQAAL